MCEFAEGQHEMHYATEINLQFLVICRLQYWCGADAFVCFLPFCFFNGLRVNMYTRLLCWNQTKFPHTRISVAV